MSEKKPIEPQDECKKLWTAQEIADESGYSVRTVRRLIKRGILPPREGTKRVPHSVVIKWLGYQDAQPQG